MMREGKVILTATNQKVIATFPNRKGSGEMTLWEVDAVDEHGQPIEEALRTFTELPLGKALEYDVEKYEHERHGTSWTLKKPRENLGKRVAMLENTVKDLADRLAAIEEGRLGDRDGLTTSSTPSSS